MEAPVRPGCEPLRVDGGPLGVLCLHGFTGSPVSMRPLAERFAEAGLSVELPRLPGHGTTIEDMVPTRFADWLEAAEAAYQDLAMRAEVRAICGLSMGGALALALAQRHPEIAALVLINPLLVVPGAADRAGIAEAIEAGIETIDAPGSDIAIADPPVLAYDHVPLAAVLSLFEGVDQVLEGLEQVRCPSLLLSSRQDHVVDPMSGEHLVARSAGPVRRVFLERSFHVATVDYDQPLIEAEALAFTTAHLAEVAP